MAIKGAEGIPTLRTVETGLLSFHLVKNNNNNNANKAILA